MNWARQSLAAAASWFLLLLVSLGTALAATSAPQRVVSINLCTDQLVTLIAAKDQIHSISYLAQQPDVSPMHASAQQHKVNHGRAEEIFLMHPDLVVSGAYSKPTTVSMLRRLGIRVMLFEPARSFAGIRSAIEKMGQVLGRRQAAAAILSTFDAEVAAVARQPVPGQTAAMYYANSYTSGRDTLAAEIVARAGLNNLGSRLGYSGIVKLPLEVLVLGQPDLVVGGRVMASSNSRSFAVVRHPAVQALVRNRASLVLSDKYWICGTPFTLQAVRSLAAAAARATAHEAGR